jgi:hypothetical protein
LYLNQIVVANAIVHPECIISWLREEGEVVGRAMLSRYSPRLCDQLS